MKYLAMFILVTFLLPLSQAQTSTTQVVKPTGPLTLQEQYKELKSDLEVIDGVRMVKVYTMDRLWNVVGDTLRAQKAKVKDLANQMNAQQLEIVALKESISKIEGEKKTLESKVDNILVFGMAYSKAGFVVFVSCLTVGLLVLIGILFAVGRTAYVTSKELRKLNENLYQEFDTYKRHAVEKEIKISRELQNHRNKLAELKIA